MNDGFATAMPPVPAACSECCDKAQADEDQIDRECDLHLAFLHLMGEVDAIAHRQEAERWFSRALELNPGFSLIWSPVAKALLEEGKA